MHKLTGIIKQKYPDLKGKDWIKLLEPEDRQVLIDIGLQATQWGKLGGIKRSQTAKRNNEGKFIHD